MITIFTCPKPFTDPHIRMIQRNAIQSWMQLEPRPEILLMGDDAGVADAAREFGLRHIPEIKRNEYGTPLVSSIWRAAEQCAVHDVMAYVNADIMLGSDFIAAVNQCVNRGRFLLTGGRTDLDLLEEIDFSGPAWRSRLNDLVINKGRKHAVTGIDYFVFRKGCWREIPPFALGRFAWDNWMVYGAWLGGAVLVDGSRAIQAVHQNHGYGHNAPVSAENWVNSREANRNRLLACARAYDVLDSSLYLSGSGFSLPRSGGYVERRMYRMAEYFPRTWRFVLSWKLRYTLSWLTSGFSCRVAGNELQEHKWSPLMTDYEIFGGDYGGYALIPDRLTDESVVYSFGVGEDLSFDRAVAERLGASVYACDPADHSARWFRSQQVPAAVTFEQSGIADYDGEAALYRSSLRDAFSILPRGTEAYGSDSCQVSRLSTIMRRKGHVRLDVLKLDIEGAEFSVIADMLASGIRPGQLLVEFHDRNYADGPFLLRKTLISLSEAGYRPFYISSGKNEYSFALCL